MVGAANIVEWMKLVDAKSIRVFNAKDKKNPVCTAHGGLDNCIAKFNKWAALEDPYGVPVQYYLRAWEKGLPKGKEELEDGEDNGTARGMRVLDFALFSPYGDNAAPGNQRTQNVTELIAAERARWHREREQEDRLLEMQDRIDELENGGGGNSAMIGAVMKGVEPVLPTIIAHIAGILMEKLGLGMPNVPALAGVETANNTDESVRVKNVINKLYHHDDKLVLHLEKLLLIAETEPVKWQMLKQMLDN